MADTEKSPSIENPIVAEAPKKQAKAASRSGAKFTRNMKNFNADGTSAVREFGEDYTEDISPDCPKAANRKESGDCGIYKVLPGEINGQKKVQCEYCGQVFASKETAPKAAEEIKQ